MYGGCVEVDHSSDMLARPVVSLPHPGEQSQFELVLSVFCTLGL